MKDRILLLIRTFTAMIHILFVKVMNLSSFKSSPFQDLSLTTKVKIRGGGKISFAKHLHARRNVVFESEGGEIKIGQGCFFNNGCMVVSKERIEIGSYTSFGPNVLIYDHDHNMENGVNLHDNSYKTEPIIIGNNVWIGANTVILRGTRLGDRCIVGAGSVIKGEYGDNSIIIQKRADSITDADRKEVHEFAQ